MEHTDYDQIAAAFDHARAKPADWLIGWREAITPYFLGRSQPILDIGSGTGIWSYLLAEWFGAEVVGVEPSSGMRAVARGERSHVTVAYVGGVAERLPLRAESCGAAWVSTVVHHIADLEAAAREIRRVLRPGGHVLIRGAFSGRDEEVPWVHFFPSARVVANQRWPSVEATVRAFEAGGFEQEALTRVREVSATDLGEYCDHVATRTDSSLLRISDEDFAEGLARLQEAAQARDPAPVVTGLDLLTLR